MLSLGSKKKTFLFNTVGDSGAELRHTLSRNDFTLYIYKHSLYEKVGGQ